MGPRARMARRLQGNGKAEPGGTGFGKHASSRRPQTLIPMMGLRGGREGGEAPGRLWVQVGAQRGPRRAGRAGAGGAWDAAASFPTAGPQTMPEARLCP